MSRFASKESDRWFLRKQKWKMPSVRCFNGVKIF